EVIVFPKTFTECEGVLADDAIVKVRGRYDKQDRGSQIKAMSIKPLNLGSREPDKPQPVEIRMNASSFNQQTSDMLMGLLREHPGHEPVTLFIAYSDGRKFRAELPVTVDSTDSVLKNSLARFAA
ncbi:MAG: hypothetical protein LBM21_02685, partial [Coriobacteriales bacterium]|nr:hypothetical protein [Coriobacteriales bacterium]